eukprot:1383807-Amorphochlora_amoeboformis.AAC.2
MIPQPGNHYGGYRYTRGRGHGGSTKASRAQFQQFRREQRLKEYTSFFFKCSEQTIARKGTARPQVQIDIPPAFQENDVPVGEWEKHLFTADSKKSVGIDFDKYEDIEVKVSGRDCEQYGVLKDFANFKGLPKFIVRNIKLCNWRTNKFHTISFSKPTPVQKHAVPVAMAGRDIMCCAQTGSGKTAAFLLPAFATYLKRDKHWLDEKGTVLPQALVLAPTRELACQIHGEALKFSNMSGFRCVCVYGGTGFKGQLQELSGGAVSPTSIIRVVLSRDPRLSYKTSRTLFWPRPGD